MLTLQYLGVSRSYGDTVMYIATYMGCPAPTNAAAISGAVPPKTAITIWWAKPVSYTHLTLPTTPYV